MKKCPKIKIRLPITYYMNYSNEKPPQIEFFEEFLFMLWVVAFDPEDLALNINKIATLSYKL